MLVEPNDPSVVGTMGFVQHFNTEELKALLNDEGRLEFMIKDCPKIKQLEGEKEMLLASNKSLAEYNLAFEPKVNTGRNKLIELHYTAAELDKIVEERSRTKEEQGSSVTMDEAIVLVQSAAGQSEEESESMVEKFMDGALDPESFIECFQTKRKEAHLRKMKAEKMKELVAKQKQQQQLQQQQPAIMMNSHAAPMPHYFNQHVAAHQMIQSIQQLDRSSIYRKYNHDFRPKGFSQETIDKLRESHLKDIY